MSDVLIYKNYTGSIGWDTGAEVYYGRVLGTKDLITYEARTLEDLQKEFENAVEDWLETRWILEYEEHATD